MTPATKFRMASHSKLFTAIAIMQLREQGKLRLDDPVSKYLPWFKAKPAGDDDGADHHRATPVARSGLQREAGDHWTSNQFPTADELRRLIRRPAGGVRALGALEVLEPRLHHRRHGRRAGERGEVGRLRAAQHLQAARHDRVERGQERPRPRPCRTGAACRTERARCSRSSTRAAWRRPPAITSNVEDMAKFVSAQFRRGARGGAQIVSTGSLREMHRVRSVEENWTSGTGARVRREPHQRPDLRRPRRRLSGQHDADAHPARRQGRRHRAHEHERLQPGRHRAAADGDGGKRGGEGGGAEAGGRGVGCVVGALRRTLSRRGGD